MNSTTLGRSRFHGPSVPLLQLTRWVLRHRGLVVVAWLALTVAGVLAVGPAADAMTGDFGALPGRPGYETNQEILRLYGDGGAADPLVLTVTLPAGTTVDSPGIRDELEAAIGRAAGIAGGSRLVSFPGTGDRGLVSADGRTTFALLWPAAEATFPPYARAVAALTRALPGIRVAGAPLGLTGTGALFLTSSDGAGPGLLAETAIAGIAALAILVFVFGSALAVVPLILAFAAILASFLVLWGVTTVTDVSFVVQYVVGLIGLGIAIDYALLVTTRWREERAAGASNDDAVERAMTTAGSAVAFSGLTVAVSLAAMTLLPVPFLRSMGIGGLIIPVFSALAAITLLPVVLATVGPRLDRGVRGRFRRRAERPGPADERGAWFTWARGVVRHPALAATLATVVLGALVVPVLGLRLGAPAPASLASSGPAREALDGLTGAGIGAGVLSPEVVLVSHADGDAAVVAAKARTLLGVRAAVAPSDPAWHRGSTRLVVVLPEESAATAGGQATRDLIRATLSELPGARIGGVGAQGDDFVDAVYGNAPAVLGLILLTTLGLLIRAFRSVLLAAKAVALNVLSVAATFGLVVLAWQDGLLSVPVWGIEATGALTGWVPVMVFAFLFGISMDYEVFILARTREDYDATGSTSQAAVLGIARTGRLVTSAALILFLAFVSLAATPGTEVKIFATALGLGILLDATIVRALLVPALIVLLGRWNWWLPGGLATALRIGASVPAEPTPRRV